MSQFPVHSYQRSNTAVAFNDGFASTIDINSSSSEQFKNTLYFLEGIINDFDSINHYDRVAGFPGIRGIITYGQRFSYDSCNHSYDVLGKRTTAYFPLEFQMNTAFSKAFIIEESGSRANMIGNNLYFDIEIYKYLQRVSTDIGFPPPQIIEQEDDYLIRIYDMNGWFADLYVLKKIVLCLEKVPNIKTEELKQYYINIKDCTQELTNMQKIQPTNNPVDILKWMMTSEYFY